MFHSSSFEEGFWFYLVAIQVVEGVVLVPERPLPTRQPATFPTSTLCFCLFWHPLHQADSFPRFRSVGASFHESVQGFLNFAASRDVVTFLEACFVPPCFLQGSSTELYNCLINLNRAGSLTWIEHRLVPALLANIYLA